MLSIKLTVLIVLCILGSVVQESVVNDQDCVVKLIEAAEKNDLETVANLLENGCDVNGKMKIGHNIWTCALRNSVHHPDSRMAALLLKYGADPNLDLGANLTPFQYSAGSSISTFKLLYSHNGDVNGRNKESDLQTPLIAAIAEGKIENVRFLIDQGVSLNPDTIDGFAAHLSTAVFNRNLEITQLLISNGADINAVFSELSEDCITCPYGITIMHRIVDMHSYEDKETASKFLDLILKYKPDLNIESDMGYTALEHACFTHNFALVDKLIENGAALKTFDFSALHCAAMFSHYKMVEHLLRTGADPNVTDVNGNTPLMVAYECCGDGFGSKITMEDRIRTTEILLNHHADPTIKNNKGESFVDMCKNGERQPLIDLLVKRGF